MRTHRLREIRLQPRNPDNIVERMACAMVNAGILDEGKIAMLQRLGFTGRELVDHVDDASTLAHRLVGHRYHQPCDASGLVNLAHAIGGDEQLMSEEIPFGQVERDLSNLVRQRVGAAITSVLQLTDGSGQAYLIALAAATQAGAVWAGTYAAHHKPETIPDTATMLEALGGVMREKLAQE